MSIYKFFLDRLNDDNGRPCPPWLQVSATESCLLPGQQFTLEFKCTVDVDLAQKTLLKQKYSRSEMMRKTPMEILILHIREGTDAFLSIYLEYVPSCFGMTFSEMNSLKKPLSKYRTSELPQDEEEPVMLRRHYYRSPENSSALTSVRIPKEIWLLVNYLYDCILRKDCSLSANKLHERPSNIKEVTMIREWLDNWGPGKCRK